MENLEKQVYKPADTSKNFMPPALPGGEKIISAMQGEILEEEQAQQAERSQQQQAILVDAQSEVLTRGGEPGGSHTPSVMNSTTKGREQPSRKDSGGVVSGSGSQPVTPTGAGRKASQTPKPTSNDPAKTSSFTQQLNYTNQQQ